MHRSSAPARSPDYPSSIRAPSTTAGMSIGSNCEELFWQHPIESSLDFTAALSQRAPGNCCRPGGLEFRELERLRHEKSSICVSDRCDPWCHCLDDTITSSSVERRLGLGPRSRRRTNCWRGDRRHSVQRVRLWPGLRLLWRARVRLLWRLRPCLRRIRPCLRRIRPSLLPGRLRSSILRRV